MTASSQEDIRAALHAALDSRGVLNEVRARLRAEVFHHIAHDKTEVQPPLCHENILINELICEYLQFNNYSCTQSVLMAETGQPSQHLDRGFMCRELNILPGSSAQQLPLLYVILSELMNRGHGSSSSGVQTTATVMNAQKEERQHSVESNSSMPCSLNMPSEGYSEDGFDSSSGSEILLHGSKR